MGTSLHEITASHYLTQKTQSGRDEVFENARFRYDIPGKNTFYRLNISNHTIYFLGIKFA